MLLVSSPLFFVGEPGKLAFSLVHVLPLMRVFLRRFLATINISPRNALPVKKTATKTTKDKISCTQSKQGK